jgi:methylmalonyl-CoA mutase
MFAGEVDQNEPTNVSLCSAGLPAKRLSTAFDSVTLYVIHMYVLIFMEKSGMQVSICCLDDAKKLYSGFDLVMP